MSEKMIPHNEFQYDKWDAFVNGRTGEQQMAWERQERARKVAEAMQAMSDTTERVDHAAAIIKRCQDGDIWGADLFAVADHAKALAAERDFAQGSVDALRKYARMLEKRSKDSPEAIRLLRQSCVVADLMDADR